DRGTRDIERERERTARAYAYETLEARTEACGQAVKKCVVAKRKRSLRAFGCHRPHHAVILALRKERHRPFVGEALECATTMRAVDRHFGGDGDMPIVFAFATNAVNQRTAAVGDHGKPRGNGIGVCVGQCDCDVSRRAASFVSARSELNPYSSTRQRRVKRRLQRAIRNDVTEGGHVVIRSDKSRHPESSRLRDVNRRDRRHHATRRRESGPYVEPLEYEARAMRER